MSNETDPASVLTDFAFGLDSEEAVSTAHDIASWVARVDPPGRGISVSPTGQQAGHWLVGAVNLTIGFDPVLDFAPVGWDVMTPPIPTGAPGTMAQVFSRIATGDSDDALVLDFQGSSYLADARVAEWAGVKEVVPWPRDQNGSFVIDLTGVGGIASIWVGMLQFVPMPWRSVIAEGFDDVRTIGLIAPDGLPPSGSQMASQALQSLGWGTDPDYPGEPSTVRVVEAFRCPTRFGVADPRRQSTPGFR